MIWFLTLPLHSHPSTVLPTHTLYLSSMAFKLIFKVKESLVSAKSWFKNHCTLAKPSKLQFTKYAMFSFTPILLHLILPLTGVPFSTFSALLTLLSLWDSTQTLSTLGCSLTSLDGLRFFPLCCHSTLGIPLNVYAVLLSVSLPAPTLHSLSPFLPFFFTFLKILSKVHSTFLANRAQ